MLFDIAPQATRQMTLAEVCVPPAEQPSRVLMEVMDKINDKHGKDMLHIAAQGAKKPFWRMQRN